MDWYQHKSGSLDDPFICDLINEFGAEGYLVYFGTLEIMAENFDVHFPGEVTQKWNYFRRKLRLSTQKIKKILNFCEDSRKFIVNIRERDVTIKCPKFTRLCSEYTKKLLRKEAKTSVGILSGQYPEKVHTEAEVEEEVDNKLKHKNAHFSNTIPNDIVEEIKSLCQSMAIPKFNPYQFVQKYRNKNPAALLLVLQRMKKEGLNIKSPWPYAEKILAIEHQNANERGHIVEHEKFKKDMNDFVNQIANKTFKKG